MLRHERSAPIWLFSFVDLAFLLLIAFTQISPLEAESDSGLAQIEIPQIESPAESLVGTSDARPWQLRVHAAPMTSASAAGQDAIPDPDAPARAPFELISPVALNLTQRSDVPPAQATARAVAQRIDAGELALTLRELLADAQTKPVLTPHPDARAEDLLVAVGLLAEVWQRDRMVAVLPRPSVAAGASSHTPHTPTPEPSLR